jgi:hypothetical protein
VFLCGTRVLVFASMGAIILLGRYNRLICRCGGAMLSVQNNTAIELVYSHEG